MNCCCQVVFRSSLVWTFLNHVETYSNKPLLNNKKNCPDFSLYCPTANNSISFLRLIAKIFEQMFQLYWVTLKPPLPPLIWLLFTLLNCQQSHSIAEFSVHFSFSIINRYKNQLINQANQQTAIAISLLQARLDWLSGDLRCTFTNCIFPDPFLWYLQSS